MACLSYLVTRPVRNREAPVTSRTWHDRHGHHHHDVRSEHDRLLHPGNQDRAASRVRPGDGQGGVRRPARRTAADRRALLRRLRGGGPAHRAGAGRWTAGHDLSGGLLAVPDIEAKLAEVVAAGDTVK